jgi:mRNA-degrading endonuclease RelE of RelBE toxin-antitoxin system
MSYKIIATEKFRKELKKLNGKFLSLKAEYASLLTHLERDPLQGTPLGKGCYKIRLSIASKRKGKSGGARVITYVYVARETVYLLSIFDKSGKENISDKELTELLKKIF